MKLQAKIWLGAGVVIAVIMSADVYLGFRAIEMEVRTDLDQNARVIRAMLMATRRVYHAQFIASELPVTQTTVGFLPAHALSHIAADFPHWINSGLRFNNVSDRPRNPANQADTHELAAMEWFRANPKATERIAEIRTPGGDFYHFTAPIWIESYCLGCHGERQSAPPSIRTSYTNSYNYHIGDLRGVMSIKLPMDELRAHAREVWLQRLGLHAGGYALLLILIGLLMQWLVVRRLAHLQSLTRKIESGDLSARAVISGNDEVMILASSFNAMADALGHREDALRESEGRFRRLTEMSSDFYWESDAEHRLTARTESKREIAESVFAQASSIGKRRWEIPYLFPDEAGWRKHRAILDAHLPFRDFEISRLRGNGAVHSISVSGDPMFDASGEFKGYQGVGADITERKRNDDLLALEHAIARSLAVERDASSGIKAVMRSICEAKKWARSTYWRVDETTGVARFGEFWDSPGLDLAAYTERSRSVVFAPGEGLVGRVWQSGEPIWVPDFADDPRVVQHALGRETGVHGVFVFPVTSEGRTIGMLAFFSREVREPDERLLAATRVIGSELGQFVQRKQAEDQVLRLNTELERRVAEHTNALEVANKELEAFSYSVSHDLRAPLRAIQGFSSLVEEQYASQIDEPGRDMLRRVGAGAKKMGTLIDDLLRLSRISRQSMRIEPVDLSALAWEVVRELQGEAPERKVEWVVAPQVAAAGDPGLLRVVLQNLMGNAWKYSSKRVDARIEFGVSVRDGQTTYFVHDNGAGFDMAYADKLFGAFQRLHSPAEFSGTGIGLATVKRIILRHGGEVRAEGKAHEGATFYFTL